MPLLKRKKKITSNFKITSDYAPINLHFGFVRFQLNFSINERKKERTDLRSWRNSLVILSMSRSRSSCNRRCVSNIVSIALINTTWITFKFEYPLSEQCGAQKYETWTALERKETIHRPTHDNKISSRSERTKVGVGMERFIWGIFSTIGSE